MENLNYVRELLKKKMSTVTTPEDIEKCNVLNDILDEDRAFSILSQTASLNILYFLGVELDKIDELYFKLLSEATINDIKKRNSFIEKM